MKKATHRKQALMIAIFLLAFTLSLFSFGTTPAAAGDVAGVSTHLFLREHAPVFDSLARL